MKRIRKQRPCNVVFTGEAGRSNHSFGRTEYIAGHRDWYQVQNKVLVATMQSGRFRVHPAFIPCVNKCLLDEVVRENLLWYMVFLGERGEGTVYKFDPSPFEDTTYAKFLCRIRIEMLKVSKCQKTWRHSCKSFKDNNCQLLRAQYEHKRETIQDQRYEQNLERAKKEEESKLSFEQWTARGYERLDEFYVLDSRSRKKLSTEKTCLLLGCSQTIAQRLRSV